MRSRASSQNLQQKMLNSESNTPFKEPKQESSTNFNDSLYSPSDISTSVCYWLFLIFLLNFKLNYLK